MGRICVCAETVREGRQILLFRLKGLWLGREGHGPGMGFITVKEPDCAWQGDQETELALRRNEGSVPSEPASVTGRRGAEGRDSVR